MYIHRIIQDRISAVLFKGKIVIIYGPRQVGKTTMVRELIKNISGAAYYSCDNPDIKEKLEYKNSNELGNFALGKKLVVFDEAQTVKDIGISLKLLHDAYPDVQIIATGSSSFELANKTKEPLTGRSLEYTLLPMSFKELADATSVVQAQQLIGTCMVYGSYPGVLFGEIDRAELLTTIASQYLYKDLLKFEGIRMPELLERLLKTLAVSIGSEISYQEISNTLAVNRLTVETYIRYLEQAFIIYRLRPFSGNVRSQLTKKQKIYFYDVGMRNALLGAFNDIELRTDKGAIWENYVVSERKKLLMATGNMFAKQYFLRTYNGQEIDLIEETGGPTLKALEIKYKKDKNYKTPTVWKERFPDIPVNIITKDNIADYLSKT